MTVPIGTIRIIEDSPPPAPSPIGITLPPPDPPTAPALIGGAPVVSSTPTPGQGVALDAAGNLPTSVSKSLLQLLNKGQHLVAFGSTTVTFPGASSVADATVSHGLPSAPVTVVAVAVAPVSGFNYFPSVAVKTISATQLTFESSTLDAQLPAASSHVDVHWIALT